MSSNLRSRGMKERIYELVSEIPAGKVVSYKHIAEILNLKDVRIVGWILNKNLSPSVPCHRVIKSNGEVGGYNRGVEEKVKRLREEGVEVIKKSSTYYIDSSYFYTFKYRNTEVRKLFLFFLFLIMLFPYFFYSIVYGVEIRKCGNLKVGIYFLNSNLKGGGGCLSIKSGTLDCRGHAIEGDSSRYSTCIYLKDAFNLTIKNCVLKNCEYGVYGKNLSDVRFYNLSTYASHFPLYLEYFNNVVVSNLSTSLTSRNSVVYLRHGTNSSFMSIFSPPLLNMYKNSLSSVSFSSSPISLLSSTNIYIHNNVIIAPTPLYVHESEYIIIENNTLFSPSLSIDMYMTRNSNVSHNRIIAQKDGKKGIGMYYCEFNNIIGNDISKFRHPIFLFESYFNNILLNYIHNTRYGIIRRYSSNNQLLNNTYLNVTYPPLPPPHHKEYIEDKIWREIKERSRVIYTRIYSYLPHRDPLTFYISLFIYTLALLSFIFFLALFIHHMYTSLIKKIKKRKRKTKEEG